MKATWEYNIFFGTNASRNMAIRSWARWYSAKSVLCGVSQCSRVRSVYTQRDDPCQLWALFVSSSAFCNTTVDPPRCGASHPSRRGARRPGSSLSNSSSGTSQTSRPDPKRSGENGRGVAGGHLQNSGPARQNASTCAHNGTKQARQDELSPWPLPPHPAPKLSTIRTCCRCFL